jgi:hypothetical protein
MTHMFYTKITYDYFDIYTFIYINTFQKESKNKGGNTEAFGGDFFDSSFYFAGSFQRFPRKFAVEKLKIELDKLGVSKRAEAIAAEVKIMIR